MWRYSNGIYNVGDRIRIILSNEYERYERSMTINDIARHGTQTVYTGRCIDLDHLLIIVNGILSDVLYSYPNSTWTSLIRSERLPSTDMIMYRE